MARYQAGGFTSLSQVDGLPFDRIRSLHHDADGWLWVGTEGRGLARLDPREWQEGRRGRIVSYRMSDGLFDEVIHQILEDEAGRLWMSSNRGIFWVRRQELLAFAEGGIPRINSTGYTERDGLRNREANGGSQPAGIKARDGRLWFPTQDGVAVVDPARVQQNRLPPGGVVEQVRAGGTPLHPGDGTLALGVEQRDLQIEYTALSFLAPANVRFRYPLDPYDGDWVDAGSRRTAYYTRVPPGRYTFRVRAANYDGVWNDDGAALLVTILPPWWRTWWAYLFYALVFTTGLIATDRLRRRGLIREERQKSFLLEYELGARHEANRHIRLSDGGQSSREAIELGRDQLVPDLGWS
jgi:ligand-binding sensor domain-containing protein